MTENPEIRPDGGPDSSSQAAGGVETWDDLEIGFSGNPKAKLDERGRLKMPAEFKGFIERKYGKELSAFYITSQDGETAEIYPLPEWQRRLGKILKMPKSHPARIKLLDATTSTAGARTWIPRAVCNCPRSWRKPRS